MPYLKKKCTLYVYDDRPQTVKNVYRNIREQNIAVKSIHFLCDNSIIILICVIYTEIRLLYFYLLTETKCNSFNK